MSKINLYPKYKTLMKTTSRNISQKLGVKFEIEPTSKKLCKKFGITKEAANCINTAEYLCVLYSLLQKKGYKIPNISISEEHIPRKHNLGGLQMGNWNIYGPGKLDIFDPSLAIHECGHYLHKKNNPWNDGLYKLFCSIRNIFRPHLNKKEKAILKSDYKKAFEQGYFKNKEIHNCLKRGYISQELVKEYRKTPEEFLIANSFNNVNEFIADYFALASCGFKFSPEITKRYNAFHGPEIKEIITKKELENLIKLRKNLEKRIDINI